MAESPPQIIVDISDVSDECQMSVRIHNQKQNPGQPLSVPQWLIDLSATRHHRFEVRATFVMYWPQKRYKYSHLSYCGCCKPTRAEVRELDRLSRRIDEFFDTAKASSGFNVADFVAGVSWVTNPDLYKEELCYNTVLVFIKKKMTAIKESTKALKGLARNT
ncbi:hypothetical protein Slin15195_G129820 [Septoria linicola]|uniref:Uncharacterized protein n=1 Tax=Septoria linicola TaxID=215465 RepID=A0A9Q9B634_9PEZI|nr:hypothetical protein Slin15195_G129820 [Septoria linicola]